MTSQSFGGHSLPTEICCPGAAWPPTVTCVRRRPSPSGTPVADWLGRGAVIVTAGLVGLGWGVVFFPAGFVGWGCRARLDFRGEPPPQPARTSAIAIALRLTH